MIEPRYMAGKRDFGPGPATLWHAVPEGSQKALCGKAPSQRWSRADEGRVITCPRCRAKIPEPREIPWPSFPPDERPYVSWSVLYKGLREHGGRVFTQVEYSIVTARTPHEAAWSARREMNYRGLQPLYPVSISLWVSKEEPWRPCGPFCAYEDCGCYYGPEYGFCGPG